MSYVDFSRRLVLQERQKLPDNAGGYLVDWVSLGTIWAKIETTSGRRENRAQGQQSVTKLRITVRSAAIDSDARVKPGQRFLEGNRVFMIDAVSEEAKDGLYLTCWAKEEVVI